MPLSDSRIDGREVYVVTSTSFTSGGPEACHQLVDALNRQGHRSWVVDPECPPDTLPIPSPYFRRYHAPVARRADVTPNSIVVLPEIYARLVRTFPGSEVFFWWLSVDHFLNGAKRMVRGIIPAPAVVLRSQLDKLRNNVALHLYQSEYARAYLEANRLGPAVEVSDYLAEEYLTKALNPDSRPREDIVAYNPLRGLERTRQVMRAFDRGGTWAPPFVPIQNMDRAQVRDLLARAKVYLDLGNHPGKDRLPREAIACGACVITNLRGSAGNPVDVPLNQQLKIDDRVPGFEDVVARKIQAVMADFDEFTAPFSRIREALALSPAQFRSQVADAFSYRPAEVVD